jgi:hydroxyacylglutathione hydrolase
MDYWGTFQMILESVVAPYFETNCWIFAPSKNSECFIVDPGLAQPNLVSQIKDVVRKHNLKPMAILVTHGHLDHTFSVLPFANEYHTPTLVHTLDRKLLSDPFKALQAGGVTQQLMQQFGVSHFEEPEDVREVNTGDTFKIADFDLQVRHAPGHTAGSVIFTVNNEYLISGDVLFAGAIGRTDMPTGSPSEMIKTLRNEILPLRDELIVLPGHGVQTTIGGERRKNLYLQEEFLSGTGI